MFYELIKNVKQIFSQKTEFMTQIWENKKNSWEYFDA